MLMNNGWAGLIHTSGKLNGNSNGKKYELLDPYDLHKLLKLNGTKENYELLFREL